MRRKRKTVVIELDEDDLLTEEERLLIRGWFTSPVVFLETGQKDRKPRRRTLPA